MKLLIAALTLFSATAFAQHQDMFVLKKSFNPQNILHFEAKTQNCKLLKDGVKAYWVMGTGLEEGLTSKEVKYFKPQSTEPTGDGKQMEFTFGAVQEMGDSIPDKQIKVVLENCKPKAYIEYNGIELNLTEIYVEVSLFMDVKFMNISGIAPDGSKKKFTIKK